MSGPSDLQSETAPDPLTWPALVAAGGGAVRVTADGETERLDREAAKRVFLNEPHLVCHTGFTARRLGLSEPGRRAAGLPPHADVAELFAFVRPGLPLAPSPHGLARALGLEAPRTAEDAGVTLHEAARGLMHALEDPGYVFWAYASSLALAAARAGWPWGRPIAARRGAPVKGESAFETWRLLKDWEDEAPRGEPGSHGVAEDETRLWLAEILGEGRERREPQFDYAALSARAFAPRAARGEPSVVLAEAGTGIGKTLGYLAPATLWARRNKGQVWISTFTKNLQRQIGQELARVFPEPAERDERVAILKGRENYLCLLNYEEAAAGSALAPSLADTVSLVLVARWIAATRQGDVTGSDFPAWLAASSGVVAGLTDRRGECIYAACRHYRRCFIEKSQRHAAHAEIVVTNHALVMSRAAADPRGLGEDSEDNAQRAPVRFVFDEGHHLFEAADGVFASHLTAAEGAELRRWLRGREGGRGRASRVRGLRERLSEAPDKDGRIAEALDAVERAAGLLPSEGWLGRLRDRQPAGAFEAFIAAVAAQVEARVSDADLDYSLEAAREPVTDAVREAGAALQGRMADLAKALKALAEALDEAMAEIPAEDAGRVAAALRGLKRRLAFTVMPWRAMLSGIAEPVPEGSIDWFGIEREAGRDADAGFYRHHLDPTAVFADLVLKQAHGVLITSATLRDRGAAGEGADWQGASVRTGVQRLAQPAIRASFGSPFDYAGQTRVFVVTTPGLQDAPAAASAYLRLFKASGGGALGLFTSIRRLRQVHARIAAPLEEAGLPLYAQHADALDAGTLVDVFREDEHACLLGTDAMRDGVDVPGRSLRLVVCDRVPWPRPDILHAARKDGLGLAAYNDAIVRLRIAQGFGRLIRRAGDKGVFVILGAATPSRLLAGLPEGVVANRVTLAEAEEGVRRFLA